ncbi:aldehyde dehydrogenase family protein [Herbiconiux sp.]|uniref:aldehyde dehydrogenase family protein n=1 Tax=Herbiconiux sp. TaxID=1871186 RepID=UPI0025BE55C5|nr:aldehyde dehydrogenase family protein [Herbiconiux sp.]
MTNCRDEHVACVTGHPEQELHTMIDSPVAPASGRDSFRADGDYENLIGGRWRPAAGGFDAIDPSVGEAWAVLPESTPADVDDAVRAAQAAFPAWSRTSAEQRQLVLLAIADRFEQHGAAFAPLLATENGRPIREAFAGDIPTVSAIFRFFAGVIRAHHGDHVPVSDPHSLVYTVREPLGVIAVILPWNSPLITLANKLAPILAAGNTAVVKPSEYASASVLEFLKLIEDLLEPGVVNVVCGHGAVGAALSSHLDVAKITFTGGPATARLILGNAALALTPALMELGGKGAMIVAEDADLDRAVHDALTGIYMANGEACIASSRLLLHDRIYDDFVHEFVRVADSIRLGDATDPATELGPLVSSRQLSLVQEHLATAREDGVGFLTSGAAPSGPGFFQAPVMIADDDGSSRIARNEVFGPVTVAERFSDYSDAVQRANSTRYGLAAGVWTKDLARAHTIAGSLKAGMVWVNKWFDLPAGMPMGGVGDSGFGRETAEQTLDEYSATKSVNIDLGAPRAQMWAAQTH